MAVELFPGSRMSASCAGKDRVRVALLLVGRQGAFAAAGSSTPTTLHAQVRITVRRVPVKGIRVACDPEPA